LELSTLRRHLPKSISHSIEGSRRSRGTSPTADDCQVFALSAVFGRSADNTSYQHWKAAASPQGHPVATTGTGRDVLRVCTGRSRVPSGLHADGPMG